MKLGVIFEAGPDKNPGVRIVEIWGEIGGDSKAGPGFLKIWGGIGGLQKPWARILKLGVKSGVDSHPRGSRALMGHLVPPHSVVSYHTKSI